MQQSRVQPISCLSDIFEQELTSNNAPFHHSMKIAQGTCLLAFAIAEDGITWLRDESGSGSVSSLKARFFDVTGLKYLSSAITSHSQVRAQVSKLKVWRGIFWRA